MNILSQRILVFVSITSLLSCAGRKENAMSAMAEAYTVTETVPVLLPEIPSEELYKLSFTIEKEKEDRYYLQVAIELFNGGHFVSPNSKRDFSGVFSIALDAHHHLDASASLIEEPLSVEEIDMHPFVNGAVNWVRQNTTYTLPLEVTPAKDFQVKGTIQFVIEPKCTLERIPIIIKYEDGDMWVELFQC